MGIIQNALNQALGSAAMATRLNPELEKQGQIRVLKKDIGKLEEYSEALGYVESGNVEESTRKVAVAEEQLAKKSEELAKLQPTQENIDRIYKHEKQSKNVLSGNIMAEANKKAADKQAAQQQQKENFKQYSSFLITDPKTVRMELMGRKL